MTLAKPMTLEARGDLRRGQHPLRVVSLTLDLHLRGEQAKIASQIESVADRLKLRGKAAGMDKCLEKP